MTALRALRRRTQGSRFGRLRRDDAVAREAAVDTRGLEAALRDRTRGEVRFDEGSRALYATDASNYRQVPIGVVVPRDVDDVVHTVAACREHGAPLLSRGGGTSLAGQCCNVAVVMDFSKHLNRVLEIDPDRRLARVEPGCVLDRLRDAARPHGLTFGPDPATHSHCTLGGMLGNNSCGAHSLLSRRAGRGLRMSDNTHELSVLTYEGLGLTVGETPEDRLELLCADGGPRGVLYRKLRRLRDRYADAVRRSFPRLPRRVSGYNLDDLLPEHGCHIARALVGTEGTCVTLLEATLHLVPDPGARSLLLLGYPDVYRAGDHVTAILEFEPTALEGFDHLLFQWVEAKGYKAANLKLLPPGAGWLLAEFGGADPAEAAAAARRCMDALGREGDRPQMKLVTDPHEQEIVWEVRESGLGSTAWVPGHADTWPGWEDSAVPPERVGRYLRELRELMGRYQYQASLYGHFGQGCIHCRIGFDLYTTAGIAKYRAFLEEAVDLVLRHGGSLSGEHGDGQSRAEFLPRMFGDELTAAFREFKGIWDPAGRMNPGKVVDPAPVTGNLRLGSDYSPPQPETHFGYPADRGSFARAALRCVGVGKCRRESGGTMCPSYMATREERHSTRGRARLLWEMLNGEVLTGGWRSEAVKEALDLCLSCKGCRSDCPVNVDMATYKAEFFSHYYAGRLRPRHAFAFGWIHAWARMAALAPGLANAATRLPLAGRVAKWVAGMAPERQAPAFAPETFRAWFRRRPVRKRGRPPVILWPDTFNDHFHPETAQAAVEVLERAGFQVRLPDGDVCCGRPLYDYGFLDLAKRRLREILRRLQPEIERGVPVVVLEPSCAAVFRDELINLFPDDPDARRLSDQTCLLTEFLEREAPGFRLPRLRGTALLHGHCHHKAVMGLEGEETALRAMGLEVEAPVSGCCGMAGAFGFERGEHYDVAVACGERVLLPSVRAAAEDTLVVADGFSCREQISQGTGREALHFAQVVQLALRGGPSGPDEGRPEAELVRRRERGRARAYRRDAVIAACGAGAALWLLRRGRGAA